MHCSASLIAAGQHVHCTRSKFGTPATHCGGGVSSPPSRHARHDTGLRLALIHKKINRQIVQGQVLKKEKDSVTRGALFADAAAPLESPCEHRTPHD